MSEAAVQDARRAFYERIATRHMTPLWEVVHQLVSSAPSPAAEPVVWRYGDIRDDILESGELISAKEAVRRVLVLENPGLAGTSRVTDTLYAGMQLILPGEVAPAHRHSQSALRFVIEGEGAYTAVEGERAYMAPFRQVKGNPKLVFQAPLRNEGHISCHAANPLRKSTELKAKPESEVSIVSGRGSARIIAWSPNEISVDVEAESPVTVAVNMNTHRDWRATGGVLVPWHGLIAAKVELGSHRLTLTFRPRWLPAYAALSFAGLLGCAVVWMWPRIRQRPS